MVFILSFLKDSPRFFLCSRLPTTLLNVLFPDMHWHRYKSGEYRINDRSDIECLPPVFHCLDGFSAAAIHSLYYMSSHTHHPLPLSLCTAINILGLTWQLKPSDGPVLNNGLGAGLPVNSDVATLPSGGRGMNWSRHSPTFKRAQKRQKAGLGSGRHETFSRNHDATPCIFFVSCTQNALKIEKPAINMRLKLELIPSLCATELYFFPKWKHTLNEQPCLKSTRAL